MFVSPAQPLPRQFVPGPKDIKVLCSDEESVALSWTAGVRLAKYGLQLRDNFHKAKMTQFKLEDLAAGDGSSPSAEVSPHTRSPPLTHIAPTQNRASKLVGMRLDKHLDKLRAQYEAQKQEEEDKKNFFRSSPNASQRSETDQGDDNSQIELSSTPPSGPSIESSPAHVHRDTTPVAPVVREAPPQPAPKPQRTHEAPPVPPERQTPYNPYPAPTGPPPPRMSPDIQTPVERLTPDKEALFSFAWYHGTIPRDEAVVRLTSMGGFDG